MSSTLLKTDNAPAFTLQIGTTVKIDEQGDNNIIPLGQVLYHVCVKDLIDNKDIVLVAGKAYRVHGTISIQEVNEDEAAALKG